MKFNELLEIVIGTLIIIILGTILNSSLSKEVSNESVNIEDTFDDYPLIASPSTQKKWNGEDGDIIKIKYRVMYDDTFIEVVNSKREVVHTQPFQRSPWEDGRFRDFTYTWMLYYTEDYGDDIPPGEYQIRVCSKNSRNIDMILDITI
jgi:hypothetical protein